MVLDVHWGEEKFWDLHGFAKGEEDAVTIRDVFFDEFAKEDGVVGGAFVVSKIDGFLDVGDPQFLWEFFQWPMKAVGQKLLDSRPDWVVPIEWFDDFGCSKF